MICKNCGKENQDGSQFCLGCGSPLEAPTPGYAPAPKKAAGAMGSIDIGGMVTGIVADVKTVDKKTLAKAISVLLAVLTIFTMMMGWTSMGKKDNKQTYNLFQFRRTVSVMDDGFEDALDGGFENDNMETAETKTTIATLVLVLDVIVYWVAFLALAGFIFLMMIKSKNAAFVGQLASVIVALAVILCIIATLIVGKFKGLGNGFDMALGLFIPLVAAAGNFAFITMKKDDLRA